MADALNTFQRTLKLPFEHLDDGLAQREVLDAALKAAIQAAAKDFGSSFEISVQRDRDGQLAGRVARGPLQILITGRYGHNTSFADNETCSFVSYTIKAQAVCSPLDRNSVIAEHLVLASKIGGSVLAASVLSLLISLASKRPGYVLALSLIFVPALWFGIWCGGKLGAVLVARREGRIRQEVAPAMAELAPLWNFLTVRFNSITILDAA